jgi:hypothetical protein
LWRDRASVLPVVMSTCRPSVLLLAVMSMDTV